MLYIIYYQVYSIVYKLDVCWTLMLAPAQATPCGGEVLHFRNYYYYYYYH